MFREAHVIVQDIEHRMSTVIIPACKGLESAKAIATFINEHSAAKVIQWKFIEGDFEEGDARAGKYNSVDQQNVLLFIGEDGLSERIVIPAPDESTLDEAQETTSDLAGMVKEMLNTHTDLPDMIYNGGGLIAQVDFP